MKIFLVEDEWIHAEDIRISVQNLGHQWLGYSTEGFDAIQKIKNLSPDIILLDIMLHGTLSGIAIAEHITKEFKKPIIFITSHTEDEIIKDGLHTNPIAYLTKPINEGDFKAALIKAQTFLQIAEADSEIIDNADTLLIRVGKKFEAAPKNNIVYIETGEKNYSKIHSIENEQFIVKKSLAGIYTLLDAKKFYRVHKEYIINLNAVTKISEPEQIVYIAQHTIPIGNTYKQGLLNHFNVL